MTSRQLSDSGNTSGHGHFSYLQDFSFGGISGGSGTLAAPWTWWVGTVLLVKEGPSKNERKLMQLVMKL